jgi:hypothetical protein
MIISHIFFPLNVRKQHYERIPRYIRLYIVAWKVAELILIEIATEGAH